MKVLWGTKKGDEFWQEQIISTDEHVFEKATKWARENDFINIRISDDRNEMPDFVATINK